MKIIYNPIFLEHDTGIHPETGQRLESLGDLPVTELSSNEEHLSLVHTEEHIERVKQVCAQGGGNLDPDTIVSQRSFDAAVAAVNAAIMASQQGDFALVRPPGHHAYPDRSSGFCLFNNIAIATQLLVNEGKKVMIFDFDAHLGNGTSDIFYNSDRVLFWSTHQYPGYPGGGTPDEIGEGSGKGYTINTPLPPGTGDDLYFSIFEDYRSMEIAKAFQPDVVAISAGFDAHRKDPLMYLKLSMNAYYRIGKLFSEHFENVFAVLEGGYNLETFNGCLRNFVDGVNGDPIRFDETPTDSSSHVKDEFEARMRMTEEDLLQYWDL